MKRNKITPRKADWRSVITIALAVPILLALLLLLYIRPVEQTATAKVAIVATGEYPPFSGEQLENNGIASAIVELALKEMGYDSQIQFMPWPLVNEKTQESATNQGVRAAFPYVKTAEREKTFYFSEPILDVETSVFFNVENTPNITPKTSLDQLSQYKLLPIEGYRYLPAVDALPKLDRAAEDNVSAFQQLIENPQVQLVAEATAVGNQILTETFPRQRYPIQSLPAFTSPLYLIASKRNPDNRQLIQDFNKALENINANQRQAIASTVLTQLDQKNQVLLNAFDSSGYLKGYFVTKASPGSGSPIRLPKGTRASVQAWPDAYLNPSNDDSATWVTVKILNGPMREEILYVDSRAVELP